MSYKILFNIFNKKYKLNYQDKILNVVLIIVTYKILIKYLHKSNCFKQIITINNFINMSLLKF